MVSEFAPKPRLKTVDLEQLETDVAVALEQQRIGASVEHVNSKDIGRLSAEAVLSQYEVSAKAIEGMGDDMKELVQGLEAALVQSDNAMKAVTELAATIRENGKLHQLKIEQAIQLSKGIIDACTDFRQKFGA